jgi:hypothetical protein
MSRREARGLESVLLGVRPNVRPDPGGATFTEGEVDHVDADGMYFTIPSWDKGKFLFGPAPWPMSRVEPTGLIVTVGTGTEPDHAAHGHGTHHHTAAGSPTTDDAVPGTALSHAGHTHPGEATPAVHDHSETVPVKGDRCLVLFPSGSNNGVQEPWVIGWWPSNG